MNTVPVLKRLAALGAGLAVAASVALPNLSAATAQSLQSQGLATTASTAIDWLEKELAASDDRFQSSFDGQSFDDIGLTIDALLAIASAGRNTDAQANESAAYVVSKAKAYATGGGTDRYAGPLGKLMVLAQARGLNPTNVDGLDLEAEVRARLQESGRFTDLSEFGDFSNGIGQAFAMLALARTPNKVPAAATNWLLAQQCPNGGFRINYTEGTSCTDNAQADKDATSFALIALKSATLTQAQAAKIQPGLSFLEAAKNATTSLIDGNANSTGLAAASFRSYGDAPLANTLANGVEAIQLTTGADKGAIAFNVADYDAAKADGISTAKRSVFQRATAQGVLALGLPSYIDRGNFGPVDPNPHIASSTSSAKTGDSITVTGGGFAAGETVNAVVESDPVVVGAATAGADGEVAITFTLPAAVAAGAHTIKLTGATSGVVVTTPLSVAAAQVGATTTTAPAATTTTRAIVRTGSSAETQSLLAGVMVFAGLALVLGARQRRVIYPFKK